MGGREYKRLGKETLQTQNPWECGEGECYESHDHATAFCGESKRESTRMLNIHISEEAEEGYWWSAAEK